MQNAHFFHCHIPSCPPHSWIIFYLPSSSFSLCSCCVFLRLRSARSNAVSHASRSSAQRREGAIPQYGGPNSQPQKRFLLLRCISDLTTDFLHFSHCSSSTAWRYFFLLFFLHSLTCSYLSLHFYLLNSS